MKKNRFKIACVVTFLLLLMAGAAKAQIFIEETDQLSTPRVESDDYWLFVGGQGSDGDQSYTPIGSGLLLLVGMGGAYWLMNRKRED